MPKVKETEIVDFSVIFDGNFHLAEKIFLATPLAVLITDENAVIKKTNAAFSKITGYQESEVIGENPRILTSGRHGKTFYERLWGTLLRTGYWEGEIWNRRKNGQIYPEWLGINCIKNKMGEITNYVGIFSDLSWIKQKEEQLLFLAFHDPLTQLPNRTLYNDRLIQGINRCKRHCTLMGVLYMDIDGFKGVNDKYGHTVGDECLIEVAKRLSHLHRRVDTVSRLGGDEFGVLLESIQSESEILQKINQIRARFLIPVCVQNGTIEINISMSIGCSICPKHSTDPKALIMRADKDMYQEKRGFSFHDVKAVRD